MGVRRGDGMNKLLDVLSWVALRCSQNKYLNAIKNTFQNYMPISLAGAVGMLWTNVLVNENGGLGAIFPLIMDLKFFSPIFEALNYASISCMSIVIVLLLSSEIAQANGDKDIYPVIVSFLSWLIVTPHTIDGLHINVLLHTSGGAIIETKLSTFVHIPHSVGVSLSDFTAQGLGTLYTSSTGLFTAMFVAIIATELYHLLRNCDCLLIKLPSQVSTNQVLSFIDPSLKLMEWISNPQISLYVTAFVEAYKYLGLYMVIFYAALIGVPDELGEAALIDGASTWQEYLYVRIPYIKPVIIANCLLVLNGSLRSFEFSYLLTHGGPGNASELMTTYMYKQAFSSMKYGYGSSVAIMIVIICMVVGMLFRKFTGGGDDE